MATQTGVVLPQIRRSHHKNQFEVVEQEYDAIRVQSPRRKIVTTYDDGRSVVTPKSGRIMALEDKVAKALEQQTHVLSQQEQVAKALSDQQRMTEGLIQKAFDNREDSSKTSVGYRMTDWRKIPDIYFKTTSVTSRQLCLA